MAVRVVIIGSGNVAEAFAGALPRCGVQTVQVLARNRQRGEITASAAGCPFTDDPRQTAVADIYIAAVSDSAIGTVLEQLDLPGQAVVAHVSGGQSINVIPEKFAHRGVLYPLQTFTAGRSSDFAEIPIFIEASDSYAAEQLKSLACSLSKNVSFADSAQRARIHTAGVFACNFVNAMYAAGAEVARKAGMPFDILKPLIAETARKAVSVNDPRSVQTGPAIRRDNGTMLRHLQLLADSGETSLHDIYSAISEYITTEYGKKL